MLEHLHHLRQRQPRLVRVHQLDHLPRQRARHRQLRVIRVLAPLRGVGA
jgi:hypothetical protein